MAYDGISKVQHYVPQFVLRNFGNGKRDQVYVFDKRNDPTFATNVKNVASESRLPQPLAAMRCGETKGDAVPEGVDVYSNTYFTRPPSDGHEGLFW